MATTIAISAKKKRLRALWLSQNANFYAAFSKNR